MSLTTGERQFQNGSSHEFFSRRNGAKTGSGGTISSGLRIECEYPLYLKELAHGKETSVRSDAHSRSFRGRIISPPIENRYTRSCGVWKSMHQRRHLQKSVLLLSRPKRHHRHVPAGRPVGCANKVNHGEKVPTVLCQRSRRQATISFLCDGFVNCCCLASKFWR